MITSILACALLVRPAIVRPQTDLVGQEAFIAVGYGGLRMTSSDGKSWTDIQEDKKDGGDDDELLFQAVFYKGKAFAVGGGAKVGRVLMTGDGKSWREVFRTNSRILPIILGEKGFISGSGDRMLTSADGQSWKSGASCEVKDGVHFRSGAFGNGIYVFSGDADNWTTGERTDFRYSTTDGNDVLAKQTKMPPTRGIAFGAGRFVLVGKDGFRQVSTDGLNWMQTNEPGEDFQSVKFVSGKFFLAGKRLWVSKDGLDWQPTNDPPYPELIAFGNGTFIATSWKGNAFWAPKKVGKSDEFDAWTKAKWGETNAITDVAWGRLGGR